MHLDRARSRNTQPSLISRQRAAKINNYLDIHELFVRTTREQINRRRAAGYVHENPSDARERMARGLEDVYLLQQKNMPERLWQFQSQWGQEGEALQQTVRFLAPEIERIQKAQQPETRRYLILTTLRIAKTLPKLSRERQEHVLGLGGYRRSEVMDIVKSIGISAVIAAGLTPVVDAILSASIIAGASNTFSHTFNNFPVTPVVALSYAAQYGTLSLDAIQNIRLMRDKRYQLTPNIIATTGGYAAKAIFPNNQRAQDIAIGIGTLAPSLLQEMVLLSLLATPAGPSLVVARNLIATLGINTPLIGVSEIFLRRKKQ